MSLKVWELEGRFESRSSSPHHEQVHLVFLRGEVEGTAE
jgi:hypothetical protein|tara:strand:- start:21 stop:137 length:117 start_codon:yes stop_codon:yes gene_type:complete